MITSCIIEPTEKKPAGGGLTRNQETMFAVLRESGKGGLVVEDWNARAREAGLGAKRSADLYDFRNALKGKSLVYEYDGRWFAKT